MALGKTKELNRFQKEDSDTLEIIREIRKALRDSNIRINDENRCWEIFERIFMVPFKVLINRNNEIEYQGSGKKLTKEQANQVLSIRGVGRFELIGVSDKQSADKRAAIKYRPSQNLRQLVQEKVKVVDYGKKEL